MQFGGVGHMNQARGIYQPLAEKVPLYDLADEEIDEERSRVPLLIVIALAGFVLAIVAAVKASDGGCYHYPLTLRLVN